jgi:hypothetical protein
MARKMILICSFLLLIVMIDYILKFFFYQDKMGVNYGLLILPPVMIGALFNQKNDTIIKIVKYSLIVMFFIILGIRFL